MKEIILKVLSDIACGNTGTCQINLQSESAREMIADKLEKELRSLLRGDFWCKYESELGYVHVGYDYYMYIGVSSVESETIERAENRGLFVEEFTSPYHPEDC